VVLRLARSVRAETGQRRLCLAGGVALNCVANGKILRDGCFERIWVQPAAGDAGGALGACFAAHHQFKDQPRKLNGHMDGMAGAYLGPSFAQDEIERRLSAAGAVFEVVDDEATLVGRAADALSDGQALGWFQGRMEFGPRALGGRSIIGDARSPKMQAVMNLKIKFRESFRPFAPAILRDRVADWFEMDADSPYMLLVADVRADRRLPLPPDADGLWGIDQLNVARSAIPAVTHVDYSARIQTVRRDTNPLYFDIIEQFHARTGCPVIVNTSFNVRGEPIVCTPEDAYRCFMRTNMDVLVLESFILFKDQQAAVADDEAWKQEFVLD
jgi:carbamoyltransferase